MPADSKVFYLLTGPEYRAKQKYKKVELNFLRIELRKLFKSCSKLILNNPFSPVVYF